MPRGKYKRGKKLLQPTSVQLSKPLHYALKRRSLAMGRNMGWLIRHILDAWFEFERGNKGTIGKAEEPSE